MTTRLLDRDLVVVRQKAKFVEMNNDYRLLDADGNDIGLITEVGQSTARKALRLISRVDQFLSHTLEVREADGTRVLTLTRPAKILKSTVTVSDGDGQPVGRIVQQNVLGRIRFALEGPNGESLGELGAESWVAWDFAVTDVNGQPVARITKQWAGFLTEGFTTADNYLLTIEPGTTGALRTLAFAAAAAVDTALKQDD
jgi:uncharacterized protein YxjI